VKRVLKVFRESKVPLVKRVTSVNRDLRAFKVTLVKRVMLVTQDLKVFQVTKVLSEKKARKGPLATWDQLDLKELEVLKEMLDQKAFRETLDLKGL
jgi:hypothetical protein